MGLLLFYVLGLAAAGSSKTSPLLVTLYMLVLNAATTPNWHAVLLLLERGADRRVGRSSVGATFAEIVEKYSRERQDGQMSEWKIADYEGFDEVLEFLRRQP